MPTKIKKPVDAANIGEQKFSTNKNFRFNYTPDSGDLQYVGIVYLAEDHTGNRFPAHATLHIARQQYGDLIHWMEYHLKGKEPPDALYALEMLLQHLEFLRGNGRHYVFNSIESIRLLDA